VRQLPLSDSAQSPGIVTPYICDWEGAPEKATSGWTGGYSVCPIYVYFSDLDPRARVSAGGYLTWTRAIVQPRLIVLFPKVPGPPIQGNPKVTAGWALRSGQTGRAITPFQRGPSPELAPEPYRVVTAIYYDANPIRKSAALDAEYRPTWVTF
jgi:hypothetical protein